MLSDSKKDVAVVVVHGVANQPFKASACSVAKLLAAQETLSNLAFEESSVHVSWDKPELSGTHSSNELASLIRDYQAQGSSFESPRFRFDGVSKDGTSLDLYELYWGDLSRAGVGFLGLLVSLFSTVLYLPSVLESEVRRAGSWFKEHQKWSVRAFSQVFANGPPVLVAIKFAALLALLPTTLDFGGYDRSFLIASQFWFLVQFAALLVLGWKYCQHKPDASRRWILALAVGLFFATSKIVWTAGSVIEAKLAITKLVELSAVLEYLAWFALFGTFSFLALSSIQDFGSKKGRKEKNLLWAVRSGQFASLTLALVLTNLLWAAVNTAALNWEYFPTEDAYVSVAFDMHSALADVGLNWLSGTLADAHFPFGRVNDGPAGTSFQPNSAVAVAVGALIALLGLVSLPFLLPASAGELQLTRREHLFSRRCFDSYVRWMPLAVDIAVYSISVVFLGFLVFNLVELVSRSSFPTSPFNSVREFARILSGLAFPVLGQVLVGGAATMLALMKGLNSKAQWVRPLIDACADIVNYVKDSPRGATHRAAIAIRYLSLLRHLEREGTYSAIVVVSHSLGTVISADGLRLIKSDEKLSELHLTDTYLFTLGSPLNQLLETMLGASYGWEKTPDALGVEAWVNAYTRDDFVGRWLWSDQTFYRSDKCFEQCLGSGGHSHYWGQRLGQDVGRILLAIVRQAWSLGSLYQEFGGVYMTDKQEMEPNLAAAAELQNCDLVMKGGVASGVVYPRAIAEISQKFRFCGIGGTSAGAIAASFAAAAEYRRQRLVESDKSKLHEPFTALSKLAEELKQRESGKTKLEELFQPLDETRFLLGLAKALVTGSKWKLMAHLLFQRLTLYMFAGVGLSFVLQSKFPTDTLFNYPLSTLVLYASLFVLPIFWVGIGSWLAYAAILKHGYGLCPGFSKKKRKTPELTDWLHQELTRYSGLPADEPLTFAHLEGDAKWIDSQEEDERPKFVKNDRLNNHKVRLRLVATCVTQNRPYTFPYGGKDLYFRIEDIEPYFPKHVVDWMKDHSKESDRLYLNDSGKVVRGGLRKLPPHGLLPVVFAVRLSLAVPLFLSGIRLYAVDYTRKSLDETQASKNKVAEPIFFTDGGISSNLPIHFFDRLLPNHPTLGINLTSFPPGKKTSTKPEENIRYARTNSDGASDERWYRFEGEKGHEGSIPSFIVGLFESARNWRDNGQLRLPAFRDRVVDIMLTSKEGGFNLQMPNELIESLEQRGRVAGVNLRDRFLDGGIPESSPVLRGAESSPQWTKYESAIYEEVPPESDEEVACEAEERKPVVTTWRNHRWVRYRTASWLLANEIVEASASLGREDYKEIFESRDFLPSYDFYRSNGAESTWNGGYEEQSVLKSNRKIDGKERTLLERLPTARWRCEKFNKALIQFAEEHASNPIFQQPNIPSPQPILRTVRDI